MLLTIVAALALVYLQGTRRAPALPAAFSVFVWLLGGLTALVLIYRVLINVPGPNDVVSRESGAFIGLLASIVIATAATARCARRGSRRRTPRRRSRRSTSIRPRWGRPPESTFLEWPGCWIATRYCTSRASPGWS